MSDSHRHAVSPIPSQESKGPRVLSCVLCQQRKIRCDRTFPCSNCMRTKVQCVPASLVPRARKRRFPERELLDRLQHYEHLLRQNDIKFNPLHDGLTKEIDNSPRLGSAAQDHGEVEPSSPTTAAKSSEGPYEPKSFWHAINQLSDIESDSSPRMTEAVVRRAWNQVYGTTDPLFGSQDTPVDLSLLHPEPSKIFRLWQIYLDNVDPVFKVTHSPSLQVRIIEAISNLKNVKPALEALMFSIYCMAAFSIMPDDCEAMLGSSKDDLLTGYQRSCRQALVQSGFLRSDDRDCLTALYLYLVSLRSTVDPRTLSSMLGIAVRAAQRMGIHSELACARYPPLEAEMRRRLWWALVLFDARIGEMADSRTTTLTPLWDCKIPLNVNDLDLRPEMKDAPLIQGRSSEALFVVVRSQIGDFLRNSACHLDFTCPALKAMARKPLESPVPDDSEVAALERMVEDQYLQFCNPENPLHFITLWVTRVLVAKYRLLEHCAKHSTERPTEAQRAALISHAIRMLYCDTTILSSATVKRYFWLMQFYFPFPAYIHLLQDLRRRPLGKHAEESWVALSENLEARANSLRQVSPNLLFRTLTGLVFNAWDARESALRQLGHSPVPPKIVSIIKHWLTLEPATSSGEHPIHATNIGDQTVPWPTPVDLRFGLQDPAFAMGENDLHSGPESWMNFALAGQLLTGGGQDQNDWPFMNWGT
ncbi:hypothetical protein BDW59DRAFT_122558 [Aspergillus cavernicola]|uniref:Zn(2)-C6 fungal-type domain-containing protein n=1 Tax=Aspergillus cavernicola TaxID=176166 RepID=A0ABR4HUY5_9EURO